MIFLQCKCDIILFSDVALPLNLKCGIQDELKNND